MEQKPMQNDPSMDFTLEDIIREFGSDAPEGPEQDAEHSTAPWLRSPSALALLLVP